MVFPNMSSSNTLIIFALIVIQEARVLTFETDGSLHSANVAEWVSSIDVSGDISSGRDRVVVVGMSEHDNIFGAISFNDDLSANYATSMYYGKVRSS